MTKVVSRAGVKVIRLQHLTPIPTGDSLKAIAEATLTEVGQRSHIQANPAGQTVWERFQEEQRLLRSLPAVAFEARRTQSLLVNNRAIVQSEGAKYSVPSTWVGRTITAAIGVEEICLCWPGETRVYVKQPRGKSYHVPALSPGTGPETPGFAPGRP
jgi:hypothetical protein